ncbi:hypothetical protein KC19_VG157100 [Ceratodon purpureus]|uniref:Uncharacterized protein n=1 Tax=Ceratodon purpureus TaxID=3225 RepID=A0A8T0HRM9_CERPU|nr:hypothetical protein KC19_VG157100 [Ceratodon purpureus]
MDQKTMSHSNDLPPQHLRMPFKILHRSELPPPSCIQSSQYKTLSTGPQDTPSVKRKYIIHPISRPENPNEHPPTRLQTHIQTPNAIEIETPIISKTPNKHLNCIPKRNSGSTINPNPKLLRSTQ